MNGGDKANVDTEDNVSGREGDMGVSCSWQVSSSGRPFTSGSMKVKSAERRQIQLQ